MSLNDISFWLLVTTLLPSAMSSGRMALVAGWPLAFGCQFFIFRQIVTGLQTHLN
jgi:hypothetical protein